MRIKAVRGIEKRFAKAVRRARLCRKTIRAAEQQLQLATTTTAAAALAEASVPPGIRRTKTNKTFIRNIDQKDCVRYFPFSLSHLPLSPIYIYPLFFFCYSFSSLPFCLAIFPFALSLRLNFFSRSCRASSYYALYCGIKEKTSVVYILLTRKKKYIPARVRKFRLFIRE